MKQTWTIVGLRISNPLNGSQGRTRGGMIARAKARKEIRSTVYAWLQGKLPLLFIPQRVTLTRIAPRKLDEHDGLTAAFKPVADGVTEALGLKDDSLLEWRYGQERGEPKQYGIRIEIEGS